MNEGENVSFLWHIQTLVLYMKSQSLNHYSKPSYLEWNILDLKTVFEYSYVFLSLRVRFPQNVELETSLESLA